MVGDLHRHFLSTCHMSRPVLDGTEINNTQSRLLRSPRPGRKLVDYRCFKLPKDRSGFPSLTAKGKLKGSGLDVP